jgi:hypothetical protein
MSSVRRSTIARVRQKRDTGLQDAPGTKYATITKTATAIERRSVRASLDALK